MSGKIDLDREFKSNFFEFFFSNPVTCKRALKDFGNIELSDRLTLIEKSGVLGEREFLHDVAFIDEHNHLFLLMEHQSSTDNNIAFRCFRYFYAVVEEKHITFPQDRGKTLIPEVHFFVFFNGDANIKQSVYKFQSHFQNTEKSVGNMFDVAAIDLNYDALPPNIRNQKNYDVAGYAYLIKLAETLRKAGQDNYVKKALHHCFMDNYLVDYKQDEEVEYMAEKYDFVEEFKKQCIEEKEEAVRQAKKQAKVLAEKQAKVLAKKQAKVLAEKQAKVLAEKQAKVLAEKLATQLAQQRVTLHVDNLVKSGLVKSTEEALAILEA